MTTTKAEGLNATINEAIAALAKETDTAKQDATFRAWLSTMSRFYSYSFGNQLLIAAQCPQATRVAGFQRWRSMGRFVKKGEKAIFILAPIVRRKADEQATDETDRSRIVGFRAASVFDLSQTDGEPLPDAPQHNATEGGDELLPRLEAAIRSYGIELTYKALPQGTQGYSKGGSIEIAADQTTAAKCGTLVHELAHELLHKVDRSQGKRQRELEAEAIAYTVLVHLGMEPGSRFYLASYGITGEMLTASMQTITATARQIIERLDQESTEAEKDSALPLAA